MVECIFWIVHQRNLIVCQTHERRASHELKQDNHCLLIIEKGCYDCLIVIWKDRDLDYVPYARVMCIFAIKVSSRLEGCINNPWVLLMKICEITKRFFFLL